MLARRELSIAQVRERLVRKGFPTDDVELVVQRLVSEGALDDERTAVTYARRAANVKLQGRKRAVQELYRLGISRAQADAAVAQTYGELNEQILLEQALARRLRGKITNQAELRRLYQYLIRQGFDSSAAITTLLANTSTTAMPNVSNRRTLASRMKEYE